MIRALKLQKKANSNLTCVEMDLITDWLCLCCPASCICLYHNGFLSFSNIFRSVWETWDSTDDPSPQSESESVKVRAHVRPRSRQYPIDSWSSPNIPSGTTSWNP